MLHSVNTPCMLAVIALVLVTWPVCGLASPQGVLSLEDGLTHFTGG